jgi:hypothetical protein
MVYSKSGRYGGGNEGASKPSNGLLAPFDRDAPYEKLFSNSSTSDPT